MTHASVAPTSYGPPSSPASSGSGGVRAGRLALALQEILTATVRLRSGRQVAADAEGFRLHAKQVLAGAEQEARAAGYPGNDVRLALFAVVVFLDESVLNSGQAMFSDWPRRPLQDELFGGHLGGEVFFQYLQQQLELDDSAALADLLEVFQLCLLLGFQGRYSVGGGGGELQALTQRVGERIARIRGPLGELSPMWRPPADRVAPVSRDPWVRRLALSAAVVAIAVAALFGVYRVSLGTGARDLDRMAVAATQPTAPSVPAGAGAPATAR